MALIDYLSKSSLFQGLPEHYLNSLAPYLRETFYKRDEYLFREGDMANDLHFITSGQVVLEMRLSNPLRRYQGDIALTSLSAPHPVAFRALIPPHRYELAARAVLDTVCVSLDCTELMPRMDSEPELGNIIRGNLIQLLSRRLMQTREVLAYERASRII